jgi:hypothetical protein
MIETRTEAATPLILGWREWVALPDLGIPRIKAKIDTGARTSALHAWNIRPFVRDGKIYVRFIVHPLQRDNRREEHCVAKVVDQRYVRSSNGHRERRYVIETTIKLGNHVVPVEISLTNRDEMGFRMLLGRNGLRSGILVAPRSSYRLGKPRSKPTKRLKRPK